MKACGEGWGKGREGVVKRWRRGGEAVGKGWRRSGKRMEKGWEKGEERAKRRKWGRKGVEKKGRGGIRRRLSVCICIKEKEKKCRSGGRTDKKSFFFFSERKKVQRVNRRALEVRTR